MNPAETLSKAKPCRRCGREIPSGTPLSALSWDRGERAWAHRAPPCAELRATSSPRPSTSVQGPARELPGPSGTEPGLPQGPGGVPDDPARGAWSVTLEIHEAEDPAQSKRVLRIARLHLGTYADAWAIAELLRTSPGRAASHP
jgi:hypothetical protein